MLTLTPRFRIRIRNPDAYPTFSILFYICRNHAVPFSKMLTFYKSEAFSVTAQYAADAPIPDKKIGVFDISKINHSFPYNLFVPASVAEL